MPALPDASFTELLSLLLQLCEDMALPGGSAPAGDAAGAGSSILNVAMPPAGEILPLALSVVAFGFVAGMIFSRQSASRKDRAAQGTVPAAANP